jgi:hypothetical protein
MEVALNVGSASFKINVSEEGLQHIIRFLEGLFVTGVARLFTGSLNVTLPVGFQINLAEFPGIELRQLDKVPADSSELGDDILTWDPRLIKELSDQNDKDAEDHLEFCGMFERTFKLSANGTLRSSRDHLVEGQRMFIRYRALIRTLTGMILQVPTLCFKYSSDPARRMKQINRNKTTMFGLFVAGYGTYAQVCKNWNRPNLYVTSLNLSEIEFDE